MSKKRVADAAALIRAVGEEREAAEALTALLVSARERCLALDAPGLRRAVTQASDAFDTLTRAASMRNAVVAKECVAQGLTRQATLADLLMLLGEAASPLALAARELAAALERVRGELRAQGLIARYGAAMMTNLIDIRRPQRAAPSYGARGSRAGAYPRAGRVA